MQVYNPPAYWELDKRCRQACKYEDYKLFIVEFKRIAPVPYIIPFNYTLLIASVE